MKRLYSLWCGIVWLVGCCAVALGQQPELVVETGHSATVSTVAFSPDGRYVASGGRDNKIKIWDAETGREIRTLTGHKVTGWSPDTIQSVRFSGDGRRLVSGGGHDTIKVWDLVTGKVIRTLSESTQGAEVFSDQIDSVDLSGDGKRVVSESGKQIKLWDVETGKELRTLSEQAGRVLSVRFSPDGKWIVSGGEGGTVKIWDAETGKEIRTLAGRSSGSVAVSADGRRIVAGGGGTIDIWDAATGRLVRALEFGALTDFLSKEEIEKLTPELLAFARALLTYRSAVTSVGFSGDGRLVVAANENGRVRIWDVETGALLHTLQGHAAPVEAVDFSADGRRIVSGGRDSALVVWDAETGRPLRAHTTRSGSVWAARISADGKRLVSGSGESTIKVWDAGFRTLRGHTGSVRVLGLSGDGRRVVTGGDDQSIIIWDAMTGAEIRTLSRSVRERPGDVNSEWWVSAVEFSGDGKRVVSRGRDYKLRVWDVETGREILSVQTLEGSVAVSRDAKRIAGMDTYGTITIWDAETGREIRSISSPSSFFAGRAFHLSGDGKRVASGASEKSIKIWEAETGREILKLAGHSEWLKVVAFSADAKRVVSGGVDGSIKVWDAEGGKELLTLAGHAGGINSLEFSGDGRLIVSAGNDRQIKIWDAATGREAATLIVIDENDWLVSTPEGFFDGTPAAWRHLVWRFNKNTFDYGAVELFFDDFFHPNLLQDVLAGRPPRARAGAELGQKDRRQPWVEIAAVNGRTRSQIAASSPDQLVTAERVATVTVEVIDNAGARRQPAHGATSGAQDLRLFRNGSLVKVWHGDVFAPGAAAGCEPAARAPHEPRRVRCTASVPVVAGRNRFTAYAFNASNVKSEDDWVSITGADSLRRDGTLYVLAVGVNKYADASYDLSFAVSDVRDIGAALKAEQGKLAAHPGLRQYAATEIVTLTDEQATKANILLALRRFAEGGRAGWPADAAESLKAELSKIKQAQPEDALIIYYAGHGTSRGQRFYLLPHDFRGGDSPEARGVSDVELNVALEKVDAGRLLMAIDACQSGHALGREDEGRAPMNSKGLAQLAYDKGMSILTAAQSRQAAVEAVRIGSREVGHGLLTYALLLGLGSGEADTDGNRQLWEREWLDYAVEQVPLLQLEAMRQRHAEVSKTGRGAELVYVEGDDKSQRPDGRKVQTPRVFYRREADLKPLVVARR